jgi:hypothetical protein
MRKKCQKRKTRKPSEEREMEKEMPMKYEKRRCGFLDR